MEKTDIMEKTYLLFNPQAGNGKYGSRIKCPIALMCGEMTYDEGEGTASVTVKADPLKELPEV